MKRGQVTTYIILGIVIIIVFSFVFFARSEFLKSLLSSITEREVAVPPEFKPANEIIKDCLNSVTEDAVYLVGIQGGYTKTTNHLTIDYFGLKAAYLNDAGKNLMPSRSVIERELADYINANARNCIINFTGVNITKIGKPDSRVSVLDDRVSAEIRWPIDLSSKDLTFELKKFNTETKVRLGTLRDLVDTVIGELISNKENICMSCITRIGTENNLYIQIFPFDKDLIFVVNDLSSVINGRPYKFMFASRF